VPSGVPGVGAVPAIPAAVVLAASSSTAVVMAAVLFLSESVPCAAQGTRLWSLSGIGSAGDTYSLRQMSHNKVAPAYPTSCSPR
jgi:hypothetical protein